jgi:hypothetical protein
MRHDLRVTWNPLRITNLWVKVGYIVLWWAGGALLINVAFAWVSVWTSTALTIPWDAAWLVVGARSFRASHEPVAPPRPWWQATGRPKASFWIGILVVVLALSALANITIAESEGAAFVVLFAFYLLVGVFYLNSGIQLKRNPRAPLPPRGGQLSDPLPKARPLKF